jgi:hypothetical protein
MLKKERIQHEHKLDSGGLDSHCPTSIDMLPGAHRIVQRHVDHEVPISTARTRYAPPAPDFAMLLIETKPIRRQHIHPHAYPHTHTHTHTHIPPHVFAYKT